jgi:hypothetical protein
MTTSEQVHKDLDALGATALRIKAERDALLAACQKAYAMLDDRYDVDQHADGSQTEYPFEGAGELMNVLSDGLAKVAQ